MHSKGVLFKKELGSFQIMETRRLLYLGLLLVILVDFPVSDSKVDESTKTDLDLQSIPNEKADELSSISNTIEVGKGKESEGGPVKKTDETTVNDSKNKLISQSGSRVTDFSQDDRNKGVGQYAGGNYKENLGGKQEQLKKTVNERDPEIPSRKDFPHLEECDPSHKCTDEENKLVACVRIPGNESPELSLLIQNRGKGPLKVTISAPDFMELEKSEVQLQEKEDQKVKVSIRDVGNDNLIILKGGKGTCNLDIREITNNFGKMVDNSYKPTHVNLISRTPTYAIFLLALLLLLASGLMCFCLRKMQLSGNGSKYEKLDMVLPVSGGGKSDSEINDGWNTSWGDDWGDEEAPKTPSMPVTPNLSANGLASRRLNKEGWKD
ncbi:hypothetical protein K2173_022571 [Erythroxylum novogranatense]|uniref:DUF7356 domain-containing protein n=1 Tax=Erythroxylum novogranatense TaxID=1862640 RepID=A0AAV8TNN0_9ROSI|nr:hypothetical protein K2173_022571 [Erythroxylum novogranatense]